MRRLQVPCALRVRIHLASATSRRNLVGTAKEPCNWTSFQSRTRPRTDPCTLATCIPPRDTFWRCSCRHIMIVFLFFCLVGFRGFRFFLVFGRVSGVPRVSGFWSGFGGSAFFWFLDGFRGFRACLVFGRVSGVPLVSGFWSGFGGSACVWILVGFRGFRVFLVSRLVCVWGFWDFFRYGLGHQKGRFVSKLSDTGPGKEVTEAL